MELNQSSQPKLITKESTIMLNRAQSLTLAVCLCSSLSPLVYADTYKVIMSTAANYQTGQKLKSATIVELKKGERLRLKAQKTLEKCTLKGPFKGKVKCPNFARNLNRLVPKTRNEKKTPSDLWALDVRSSGNFCYDQAHSLTLWRSEASQTESLTLQDRDAQIEIKLQWPKDKHYLPWPNEAMNIRDNGRYQLKAGGSIHYTTLHILPSYLQRPSDKSVWMAQQGCAKQIDMVFTAEHPSRLFD